MADKGRPRLISTVRPNTNRSKLDTQGKSEASALRIRNSTRPSPADWIATGYPKGWSGTTLDSLSTIPAPVALGPNIRLLGPLGVDRTRDQAFTLAISECPDDTPDFFDQIVA